MAGGLPLGLASTLTAVVLGIVTASAADEYDQANDAVASVAVGFAELGDILHSYGQETAPIQSGIKQVLQNWTATLEGAQTNADAEALALPDSGSRSGTEAIYAAVASLKPATEVQKELRSRALNMIGNPTGAEKRWLFTVSSGQLPPVFLIAILAWIILEFLCSPPRPAVYLLILVAAVVVSSAMFLVLELKDPITGFVRVSTEPLTRAIALFDQ